MTAPSVPSTPTPPQMVRASVNSIQFSWSKPESKGGNLGNQCICDKMLIAQT